MGKFGNIRDLQTDKQMEQEGIDLNFGDGRIVTVARAGGSNRKYRVSLMKAHEPHKTALEHGSLDEDTAVNLLHTVFAESVVLGWQGWKDEDGNDLEYSVENAIQLFREAPEIFSVIRDESEKFSNFARKEVEDSGN